jgi:DNA-binding NarL/FixJ family response regulator
MTSHIARRRAVSQRRTGVSSRTAPIELSPRQREILSLIAHGFTSREIAVKLGLSVRTIEVHRYHLMQRVHVRNVAQLLRQAMAHGLVRLR